jgi:predicted nucleic acid-binding protein
MVRLFVDTAGWGNLVDTSQPHHAYAATIYRTAKQQRHEILTTNYILAELVALLTSPLRIPRPKIIAFINGLKTSPYVEIVHVDTMLDQQAWQLLMHRQDKAWSLVDCSSFVLMQQRGIIESLTTDHHFEQAGFIRLLKPS